MFSVGKQLAALASLPLATAAVALPAPASAADVSPLAIAAAPLAADTQVTDAAGPAVANAAPLALQGDPAAKLVFLIAASAAAWSEAPQADEESADDRSDQVDPELECMAKVVLHEAGNQPRRGQLAVAQVIMNRIGSGRFPTTACGVANQRGQFFSTASYNPSRDSAQWESAVAVSRQARDGTADAVAPGALFYHAAYAAAGSFFRSRQRVVTLGDHIFYR